MARWIISLIVLLPSGALKAAPSVQTTAFFDTTPLYGLAHHVHDGDSLHVNTEFGQRLRIRLAGVDAPELEQDFGTAARDFAQNALLNRRLRIQPIKRDVYQRVVAQVTLLPSTPGEPEQDLAELLLESGMAWHFLRYRAEHSRADQARYAKAEHNARLHARGLWQAPAPQAPWTFRAGKQRQARSPHP